MALTLTGPCQTLPRKCKISCKKTGARAVALAQIGQLRMAEAELHGLDVRKDS